MKAHIQAQLREFKRELRDIYGERLKGVYLFGSYARAEEDPESDLDVLIVLDAVPNYSAEISRTGGVVSQSSLALGVSVSVVFVSEEAWGSGQSLFLLNAREEAVAA